MLPAEIVFECILKGPLKCLNEFKINEDGQYDLGGESIEIRENIFIFLSLPMVNKHFFNLFNNNNKCREYGLNYCDVILKMMILEGHADSYKHHAMFFSEMFEYTLNFPVKFWNIPVSKIKDTAESKIWSIVFKQEQIYNSGNPFITLLKEKGFDLNNPMEIAIREQLIKTYEDISLDLATVHSDGELINNVTYLQNLQPYQIQDNLNAFFSFSLRTDDGGGIPFLREFLYHSGIHSDNALFVSMFLKTFISFNELSFNELSFDSEDVVTELLLSRVNHFSYNEKVELGMVINIDTIMKKILRTRDLTYIDDYFSDNMWRRMIIFENFMRKLLSTNNDELIKCFEEDYFYLLSRVIYTMSNMNADDSWLNLSKMIIFTYIENIKNNSMKVFSDNQLWFIFSLMGMVYEGWNDFYSIASEYYPREQSVYLLVLYLVENNSNDNSYNDYFYLNTFLRFDPHGFEIFSKFSRTSLFDYKLFFDNISKREDYKILDILSVYLAEKRDCFFLDTIVWYIGPYSSYWFVHQIICKRNLIDTILLSGKKIHYSFFDTIHDHKHTGYLLNLHNSLKSQCDSLIKWCNRRNINWKSPRKIKY